MEIKEFGIEYYEEVYSLWKSCEGIGLSDADSIDAISSYLNRNPGFSLVCIKDDLVTGVILCGHDGRRGYIHHLAVHEKFRNQGIANAMVKKCLDRLERAGIKKSHLFIFKNNVAVSFWKNTGWEYRNDIAVMSYQK